MKDIERFIQKIRIDKDGCWVWTASQLSKGYGQFCFSGKRAGRAHRFSYEYFREKIPDGYTIDHLCKNRLCVNPRHLDCVTNKENVLRGEGVTAKNARKTHCKNGHSLEGKNIFLRRSNNTVMRVCLPCRREYLRKWRHARKNIDEDRKELEELTN